MTDSTASPGQASRRATLGLLAAILLLLIWYLLADRLTPYSSQARVQAFVVPVAAEVSGQIKRVYVHDSIYDDICSRLARLADAAVVDDGLKQGTTIGPVQNRTQFEKLKEFLADAKASGRIIAGTGAQRCRGWAG